MSRKFAMLKSFKPPMKGNHTKQTYLFVSKRYT